MSGWSRSRSQSRLSSWGQAQDLMTLSNELDQRRKELRLERKPSRSLDPHYIAQRQAQRARSREAQARLSTMGILTPSLLPNPNPNPNTQTQTQPTPSSNPTPIRSSSTPHALDPKLQAQAHEILQLRTQLNQLRSERDELKDRLKASNQKSSSDLQSFEIERRLMIQLIKNLKAEVEEGWNRVIRLRETYQGLVSPNLTSHHHYQSHDIYESIHLQHPLRQPTIPRRPSTTIPTASSQTPLSDPPGSNPRIKSNHSILKRPTSLNRLNPKSDSRSASMDRNLSGSTPPTLMIINPHQRQRRTSFS